MLTIKGLLSHVVFLLDSFFSILQSLFGHVVMSILPSFFILVNYPPRISLNLLDPGFELADDVLQALLLVVSMSLHFILKVNQLCLFCLLHLIEIVLLLFLATSLDLPHDTLMLTDLDITCLEAQFKFFALDLHVFKA